jgi:hypothetical protein
MQLASNERMAFAVTTVLREAFRVRCWCVVAVFAACSSPQGGLQQVSGSAAVDETCGHVPMIAHRPVYGGELQLRQTVDEMARLLPPDDAGRLMEIYERGVSSSKEWIPDTFGNLEDVPEADRDGELLVQAPVAEFDEHDLGVVLRGIQALHGPQRGLSGYIGTDGAPTVAQIPVDQWRERHRFLLDHHGEFLRRVEPEVRSVLAARPRVGAKQGDRADPYVALGSVVRDTTEASELAEALTLEHGVEVGVFDTLRDVEDPAAEPGPYVRIGDAHAVVADPRDGYVAHTHPASMANDGRLFVVAGASLGVRLHEDGTPVLAEAGDVYSKFMRAMGKERLILPVSIREVPLAWGKPVVVRTVFGRFRWTMPPL